MLHPLHLRRAGAPRSAPRSSRTRRSTMARSPSFELGPTLAAVAALALAAPLTGCIYAGISLGVASALPDAGTAAPPNTPPGVAVETPAGPQRAGRASIAFTITDAEGDPATVTLEY